MTAFALLECGESGGYPVAASLQWRNRLLSIWSFDT
jgi:hypothetical protein